MTGKIEYIIDYSEGNLSESEMQEFERELLTNNELNENYLLYKHVNDYMRAKFDIEEVKKDPFLQEIKEVVDAAITDYNLKTDYNQEDYKFIKDAHIDKMAEVSLQNEINIILKEIEDYNINEIAASLVNEFIEKENYNTIKDPETENVRNFIRNSLEPEKSNKELKIIHNRKIDRIKSPMIRIVSISAAALIAGVVLMKTLIPANNTEKLYASFYKPCSIESSVIRGSDSELSDQLGEAINYYRLGKYDLAVPLLNGIIQKDTSNITASFYLGITQIELGNFRLAITELTKSLSKPQEFTKEAQWYLGLTYLKIGEKSKAIPFFKILSESEGFYQDQAKKLLRRL